jgi:hypothetical protein
MLLYCPTDATVPATQHLLQLSIFALDFFSSSSVYVTVPTIKSSLTLLPATHGCGYQLCFVTNRFMKLSYCLLSFCSVSPALFLQKIKKESVYVMYSSQHRTENFIHAYDKFENFITGEGLGAVPSLLYSNAVGRTVIKEAPVRALNFSIFQRHQGLFHEFGVVAAVLL